MGCCDDPTEPVKIQRSDLVRVQQQYGELVRDLFSSDPEKVMLRQLQQVNTNLREIAALNAHYDSVRKQAIKLLSKDSISVMQRIIDKDANSELAKFTQKRIEELEKGVFN